MHCNHHFGRGRRRLTATSSSDHVLSPCSRDFLLDHVKIPSSPATPANSLPHTTTMAHSGTGANGRAGIVFKMTPALPSDHQSLILPFWSILFYSSSFWIRYLERSRFSWGAGVATRVASLCSFSCHIHRAGSIVVVKPACLPTRRMCLLTRRCNGSTNDGTENRAQATSCRVSACSSDGSVYLWQVRSCRELSKHTARPQMLNPPWSLSPGSSSVEPPPSPLLWSAQAW